MPQFDTQSCVLCPTLSSRRGEHVEPRWFRDGFTGQGPFTIEKGDTPYENRDGDAITEADLPGMYVPMCRTHNNLLNCTVEEAGKPVVRKLLEGATTGQWPTLIAEETQGLAVWLAKVAVLREHPDAEHSTPIVNLDIAPSRLPRMEDCWIDWLRHDPAIPDGFSVFMHRRSFTTDPPLVGDSHRVWLPHVSVGAEALHYRAFNSFGFTGVQALVVWHPGWPMTHPLAAEGRAVQLWPNPQPVDMSVLPEVNSKEVVIVDHGMDRMFRDWAEFNQAVAAGGLMDDPIAAFIAHMAARSDH